MIWRVMIEVRWDMPLACCCGSIWHREARSTWCVKASSVMIFRSTIATTLALADQHDCGMLKDACYRRRVVKYLEYDREKRDNTRSISRMNMVNFRLVQTLSWSNSHTSSIDVLCYWDWFFSLSFGIFRGCLLDVLDVDLSSLFIVREPTHKI